MDQRSVIVFLALCFSFLLVVQLDTARAMTSYQVTVEPNVIIRGELFDIRITNATANATIVILWVHENSAVLQQTFHADENGSFLFTVGFSQSLEVGLYQLWVRIGDVQQKAVFEVRYTDRERYLLDLQRWSGIESAIAAFMNAVIGFLVFLTIIVIVLIYYMHYRFHRPVEITTKGKALFSWFGQRFIRRQYDPYQKVLVQEDYDPLGHALHQTQTYKAQFDESMKFAEAGRARAELAIRKVRQLLIAIKGTQEQKTKEKLAHELKLQVNEYKLAKERVRESYEIAKESHELQSSWEDQTLQIAVTQKITFVGDAPVPKKVKTHGVVEPQETKAKAATDTRRANEAQFTRIGEV